MTFVLQLHFVKMKLNLKKRCKKKFCVLIIYCKLFLLPLIGLQFHLNTDVFIPDFCHSRYNNLTVTVVDC